MQQHYSSSPTSLSSPPSALSEPGSPTRFLNAGRANIEMDEIVVDPAGSAGARFGVIPQPPPPQPEVRLTAAGLPRKKPGRKPGSTVKPKVPADGSSTNTDPPKQRRPRKPRDPALPPIQRKRKAPHADESADHMEVDSTPAYASSSAPQQTKITELTSMRVAMDARPTPAPPAESTYVQKPLKREGFPGSMQNILNDDPPPNPQPSPPVSHTPTATTTASSRPIFDPVRGNYDPVRETMVTRDPYGTGPLGSPRAPTQVVNRASASPSIASLVDPPPPSMISPVPANTAYNKPSTLQSRYQESSSVPASPSNPARNPPPPQMPKPTITEIKRPPPPPPPAAKSETVKASKSDVPKPASFTSMTTIPSSLTLTATAATPAPVQSKKVAAVVQQEREHQKKKASSSSSSPKVSSLRDALPPVPNVTDRSILDFGKANPGEEVAANIVLHIPLNGETNKYVNFMRMAEERYGWDALNPRLAANRDRKARIAAATAALEKTASGRESGDEMEEDLQSEAENSNVEMGGMGTGAVASGPEAAPAKPARKKRNFKEDEYDKDDDFVDDSEMLWEEQAAASRDGFFVYSGPLIPEVEKPVVPEGPVRRGRGGRGSRGGRGGTTRGGGEGTGRGRGGGPGSRGGSVTRKPRITKLEKEQRDREKAEREKLAQMASKAGASSSAYGLLQMAPAPTGQSTTAGAS